MPKFRKQKEFVVRRQQYRRAKNAFIKEINQHVEYSDLNVSDNSDTDNNVSVVENVNFQSLLSEKSLVCNENINEPIRNDLSNSNDNINNDNIDNINNYNNDNINDIDNDNISNSDDLKLKLTHWATVKHNISRSALTDLLHILVSYHPELPLDSRTLLETPVSTEIISLNTGEFCYIGLENALKKVLRYINCQLFQKLEICFNVDGIPLFRSSREQLWPILGQIKNFECRPFVVALFSGKSKPKPINQYLNNFVIELNNLLQNGFCFNGKFFEIKVHSFVCDAPARAFLKCIKSHTGYSCCEKCTEGGQYYKNKIVLLNTNAQKRTNELFRKQDDIEHHLGETPLLKLPIDLIKCFPIDYMHNICLGIMRKLLNTWLKGPLHVRLSQCSVNIISDRLINLKIYMPSEFNRKPRSLDELANWKATEFRLFLLYVGPFVLRNILDTAVYENFLLIHFFVSILLSDIHIKNFGIPFVQNMINIFIKHCKNLYGLEFLVYNVHIVSHICDDVNVFGPLDKFSAFAFESYLGQLKKLVKSPKNILQQIHRRLAEINSPIDNFTQNNIEKLKYEHVLGPLINSNHYNWKKQFKKLCFNNITLTIYSYNNSDCYCSFFHGNAVVQIHNIVVTTKGRIYIIGKQFLEYQDLYSYPCQSSDLNIFIVKNLSTFKLWPINNFFSKCIVYPFNNISFVSLPIIHSFSN